MAIDWRDREGGWERVDCEGIWEVECELEDWEEREPDRARAGWRFGGGSSPISTSLLGLNILH